MPIYSYSDIEQKLIENSLIPFAVFQYCEGKIVTIAVTKGLSALFGYESLEETYEGMNNDLFRNCHPDDLTRLKDMLKRLSIDKDEVKTIYRYKIGAEYRVFRFHGVNIYKEGGIRLVNGWFADEGTYMEGDDTDTYSNTISKAVRERTKLHFFNYDYLTGLPNMGYFFELAKNGREEILKSGEKPCVLFFDLCGMKAYNQKFGFLQGDQLLIEFSRMIAKKFGQNNCGRFGGDHFCAFTAEKGLDKALDEILEESKWINNGQNLPVRIGVYKNMGELANPSIACDRAKRACDAVRSSYFSCVSYFDEEMLKYAEEREYVITNIDKALEEGWIQVFHQPIIRTANGKVSDEEALARWDDPDRGMISPGVFIPALEDARIIYKLDLFVAKEILKKMKKQMAAGIYVVPESVNISRADFNICDIVDEITKLVDESGIGRDKLTIEITESGVGTDVEYIKTQIERFHELGFKVWMDDYGSGYSSPEILQEIPFDTIKLDMDFMRKFDKGDSCKIIVTELVKMAGALGIETVAEGVETVEQVEFLKEIGCTKIQGYHFCQPISIEALFDRYATGKQIGFENPDESDYYTTIGKISLYDLHMSAEGDEDMLGNYFDTMPMAIMETSDTDMWLVRANKPYKDFFSKNFEGYDMNGVANLEVMKKMRGSAFSKAIIQCGKDGRRIIIDERGIDGTILHIFIRRVAINPVTGVRAIAIAILGINEDRGAEELTYTYIAQALSSDCINLYYVDLDTDKYIEYSSGDEYDDLAIEEHGTDFFEKVRQGAMFSIYEEDRDFFLESFTKEKVEKKLAEEGTYTLSYRYLMDGEPIYVHMKIVRIKMKGNSIIIGVSNINTQMKEQEAMERVKEENLTYSRLSVLAENFISIFVVDPETGHYIRCATNHEVDRYTIGMEGEDFFGRFVESRKKFVYLEDLDYALSQLTRENILKSIEDNGVFTINYRIFINNEIRYCKIKVAFAEEKGGRQLIFGISDITDEVLHEQEVEQKLIRARNEANVDGLTGVKNKHAYDNMEKQINRMIKDGSAPEFALVVLDINGLKTINDTLGHQAGDEFIKKGCSIICDVFRHCPVFRVGGDEFVVVIQGRSYKHVDKIMQFWDKTIQESIANNSVVIAAGMARFTDDKEVKTVFARADALMYENKKALKSAG
ncbi:sensor domain-containing diguanylate cyclase [Butyrivibrio sp. AE3009]|uniref:sensor domain-containing diguanylate cyclase n=1 Tax=Butyrivibrio sp. AE3009 TaxID=1280666 RepID=UPI0003B419B9|nr:EAL domain-containing protein [Butyrivibrio sp. AE3009]